MREITTIAEAIHVSRSGLVPTTAANLRQTRDMLRSHLQSDIHEVRLVLDQYNLTAQSLLEVGLQLRALGEEDGGNEIVLAADDDEYSGDGGERDGDEDGGRAVE
jgi:hypothetical protein